MQQRPKPVPQIVITGGPASGKTTALEHLRVSYPELEFVEEAATYVLSRGFPLPTDERPWTQEWQNELQIAIASQQLQLEEVAIDSAQLNSKSGIVQDRGLLDGAAYLSGGVREFEELAGLDHQEVLNRYDTVIYLGWLSSNSYETDSNPVRFEDEERARVIARTILESWADHPNLIEVTAQQNRAQEVAELVRQAVIME